MCSEMTNTLSKGARKIEKCRMNSFIIVNISNQTDGKSALKITFIKFYKKEVQQTELPRVGIS